MPYIQQEKRNKITPVVHGSNIRVESQHVDSAGDLNYAFTILAIDYIRRKGLNYQNLNDIVGAFEGAKAEFQRRVVADYENSKADLNSDVYPDFRTPIYPSAKNFNGN